jgi:NHLM bacteriocin system ABC transporter ATP-binding protein
MVEETFKNPADIPSKPVDSGVKAEEPKSLDTRATAAFDARTFSDSLLELGSILDDAGQREAGFITSMRHVPEVVSRLFSKGPNRLQNDQTAPRAVMESQNVAGSAPVQTPDSDFSLALTLRVIGRHMGLSFVFPAKSTNSNQADLLAITTNSKIKFRKVSLRPGWWKDEAGAILAFFKTSEQPVALLPDKKGSYRIYDPIAGSTVPMDSKVASELEQTGYVFYRPLPPESPTIWSLVRFALHGCRRDIGALILSGVAGGLLALIPSLASAYIVDQFLPAGMRRALLQSLLLLLSVAFSLSMLAVTRAFAVLRIEGKMDANLQTALWDRLISLPATFFREYTSGDLAIRSLGVSEIRKSLTNAVASSLLSFLFSAFSLLLLFWFDWRLAIVTNLLVIVAMGVGVCGGLMQLYFERQLAQIRGQISGIRVQLVNGISKLRSTGAERRAFAFWSREYRNQLVLSINAGKVSNAVATFTAGFPLICFAIIFYLAAGDMRSNEARRLTIGGFIAFMSAFAQFLNSATQFSASAVSIMRIFPLYERIVAILEAVPEGGVGKKQPGRLVGAIELRNMSYRYKSDFPLVLSNISLSVKSGEFVALVGPSGCGKSTSLRLLLGFDKPQAGSIFYDGESLEDLDIELVRRQIGVVLQHGRIMNGSILENIAGSGLFSLNEAWDAASSAALDRDIQAMPMGMHTLVGEGGIVLSAGQRQRLMIARAIIRRPAILLLDEATSALDNHTQSIVIRNLEQLKVTRVVVAQRLSTIVNADRIFVMDKGRIVQTGNFMELMKEEGLFRELAQRQLV